MKSVGKGILSGKDVCMLEHLPRLLADGHRHFRIETVSESPAYRREVAAVYRAALDRAAAGDGRVDESWWETIRRHARIGLCNGFYFGKIRDGLRGHPAGLDRVLTDDLARGVVDGQEGAHG